MLVSHSLERHCLKLRCFGLLLLMALYLIALPRPAVLNALGSSEETGAASPRLQTNNYRSPGACHKLFVFDPNLEPALFAPGKGCQAAGSPGRKLAEHFNVPGQVSFQVWEVNTATAEELSGNQNVAWRDEENQVLLNAIRLDTTVVTERLREVSGSRQLHLVQFAGPIKDEWRAALEATGVAVVTYIPFNAYLVYGDATRLNALWSSIDSGALKDAVQWDGKYKDRHKLDPGIQPSGGQSQNSDPPPPDIDPQRAGMAQGPNNYVAIQLVDDSIHNAETVQLINNRFGESSPGSPPTVVLQFRVLNYVSIIARISNNTPPPTGAAAPEEEVARRPDVISVTPHSVPAKQDERLDVIVAGLLNGNVPQAADYLNFLASQGISQMDPNYAINISDSGVDNGTILPNHFALYPLGVKSPNASRVVYNLRFGTPNPSSALAGCDGHGTINAHIIAGYIPFNFGGGPPHADAAGFRHGLGVAPFVRIGSSVIFDPDDFTHPDPIALEEEAYSRFARISSNSWGANLNRYSIYAQAYDALVRDAQQRSVPGNQQYTIVFGEGNDGSNEFTVGAPGGAKNVITVGSHENVRPLGAEMLPASCLTPAEAADNANQISNFSSRGPTFDLRAKPDLLAPGSAVTGGVVQSATPGATGLADPCFSALGVCGSQPSAGNPGFFFPAGQEFYTISSGTSHATAAVAGAAALVRQGFINRSLNDPSPAAIKAVLMNSARRLPESVTTEGPLSNNQGTGAVNLTSAFDLIQGIGNTSLTSSAETASGETAANLAGTPTILRDQAASDLFTSTGQTRVVTGNIGDPAKPFRVTLVWTDAPGSTAGAAFVNNLDLEVTAGGATYLGNAGNGAFSTVGGALDARNNVENVFLPAGLKGPFSVRVRATNIAGDGVPGNASRGDQDFALVIYNAVQVNQPVLAITGATVVTESGCAAPNTAIDPGERVTVSFSLRNVGSADTGEQLVAALQPGGGILSPDGPRVYGKLVAGGRAVSQPFGFTAAAGNLSAITATLLLQDRGESLGDAAVTLPVGELTRVNQTGRCDAVVTFTLPGNPCQVSCTPSSGARFAAGVTTVNCITGMRANFSFKVRVNDTEPPRITCPANQTRNSEANQCSAAISAGTPAATDNCAGLTLTTTRGDNRQPLNAPFPSGITTLVHTATDAAGNRDKCLQTVRVRTNNALSCSTAPPLNNLATVSAANYVGRSLAPESIVAAFGTGLAVGTLGATALPLPTSLLGTQVTVRDRFGITRAAQVFFVSPTQINFPIPPNTAAGAAQVSITSRDGRVSNEIAQIVPVAPGLFTANASGSGVAAGSALRVRAGGEQSYEPLARFDQAQNRWVPIPIDLGPAQEQVFLILYGTGIRHRSSLSNVSAAIGGVPTRTLYAGPQGSLVGLDQINLELPRSLAGRGEVDVAIVADGKQANAIRIAVK